MPVRIFWAGALSSHSTVAASLPLACHVNPKIGRRDTLDSQIPANPTEAAEDSRPLAKSRVLLPVRQCRMRNQVGPDLSREVAPGRPPVADRRVLLARGGAQGSTLRIEMG